VPLHRLVTWIRSQIQPVPEDAAVCEFDCHRTDCRHGDWVACERRLATASLTEERREAQGA
jgi:hypothetical protein